MTLSKYKATSNAAILIKNHKLPVVSHAKATANVT